MNTRVAHFYKERRRTTPTFEMMLELLQTQNRIIYQVLTIEQGLDLRNLYGTHNLKHELETRADAAFLVVQSSVPDASSGVCAACRGYFIAEEAAQTHPEPPSYPCIPSAYSVSDDDGGDPLGHGKVRHSSNSAKDQSGSSAVAFLSPVKRPFIAISCCSDVGHRGETACGRNTLPLALWYRNRAYRVTEQRTRS